MLGRLVKNARSLPAVGDLGIGGRIAKTRRRLIGSVCLVSGAYAAYSLASTTFIRQESNSVGLNLFLITGAMLLMLLSSFVQGILFGDLVFAGGWRERVILGQETNLTENEQASITIGKLKDGTMPFYLVCAGLLVFNYVAYGWMTSDFLDEYHDWGYQNTLLRSEDPAQRIRGLRNLAMPRNASALESEVLRESLVSRLADDDPDVRDWAVWVLGEQAVYEASWELEQLVINETLDESFRALAAESLGRMGSENGALTMARLLSSTIGRDDLALGLLRGLGMARIPTTASYLADFRNIGTEEIRAHAYWALGRTGNREYRDLLVDVMLTGSPADRCFAAEGMKYLVDADDLIDAHTWYASADGVPDCAAVIWRRPYHWDDERAFRQDIVIGETLRAKFLKLVFVSGGPSQRDFFAEIANDTDETAEIRALATELANRIDHHL